MPIARKSKVQIETRGTTNLPSIYVDGDKIRQVLINIVGNAVKFNRENGKVEIEMSLKARPGAGQENTDLPAALGNAEEEMICIEIKDTGQGIPPEKLERIFDSFYQVDGSSTREHGGTGLGLAIARSLVDAHGGSIEVASEESKGSVFTVLLPVELEP